MIIKLSEKPRISVLHFNICTWLCSFQLEKIGLLFIYFIRYRILNRSRNLLKKEILLIFYAPILFKFFFANSDWKLTSVYTVFVIIAFHVCFCLSYYLLLGNKNSSSSTFLFLFHKRTVHLFLYVMCTLLIPWRYFIHLIILLAEGSGASVSKHNGTNIIYNN